MSMIERIVICFRSVARDGRSQPKWTDLLDRARELVKRAEVLGGALCAWSSDYVSFSFPVEDLEASIELVAGAGSSSLLSNYAIGISKGPFLPIEDRRGAVEFGLGPVQDSSLQLSGLAQPGEVVLDSQIQAVHRGDLLTCGWRSAEDGSTELQGYLLDLSQPWRTDAERTVENLLEPPLIGNMGLIEAMQVVPGTLAVVRIPAGYGGSRMLRELALAAQPSRTLIVEPFGYSMEPLGSLRRAFSRSAARLGKPRLDTRDQETLTRIVASEGSPIDAAAVLLEHWLSLDTQAAGLLLVDEANLVDSMTLEVIAASTMNATHPFASIVRLHPDCLLPAELASLPPGPDVEALALSPEDTERFADECTGRKLSAQARDVVAKRAGGIPLAIIEALNEALTSGELSWGPKGIHLRAPLTGPVETFSAKHWIERRLTFVPPVAHFVLFATALTGGDASIATLDAVLRAAADVPIDIEREVQLLTRLRWLVEPEQGWVSLPTRTHRDVVFQSIAQTRRISWHRAISLVIESSSGKLACAEAGKHAELANDGKRAARLLAEAGVAASRASLNTAARDLHVLASAQIGANDVSVAPSIAASPYMRNATSSVPIPGASFALELTARGILHADDASYPPLEVPTLVDGDKLTQLRADGEVPRFLWAESNLDDDAPQTVRAPAPLDPSEFGAETETAAYLEGAEGGIPLSQRSLDSMVPVVLDESPVSMPSVRIASATEGSRASIPRFVELPDGGEDRSQQASVSGNPMKQLDDLASHLPLVERSVLASKDMEALESWVETELPTMARARALRRFQAIVAIDRGDRAQALLQLQHACDQAASLSAVEQARCHLAYALGLTRAGRHLDALVEALEAMARARETGNVQARTACARFLRTLHITSGHGSLADAWGQAANDRP